MAARTPALQPRSEYHRNWGNYTDGGQTTPANGDLPNQASNPLADPEYSKLEAGDLAYVTTTDEGVYYCFSPGTLSGGDAIWRRFVDGPDTIRDAHQLVVAQEAPFEISTVGSGANAVGVSCDFLDAGDGLGLEAALAAAAAVQAATGLGVDVRVRPCAIVLDVANLAVVPLSIPAQVRLIGAGGREGIASRVTGGDGTGGTSQRIFALGQSASLEDFDLLSPAAAVIPLAEPGHGLVMPNNFAMVRNCKFSVKGGGAANRSFGHGIGTGISLIGISDFQVDNCFFSLTDLIAFETANVASYAVALGDTTNVIFGELPPVMRHCSVVNGNGTIQVINRVGAIVQSVVHRDASNTGFGAITHVNVDAGNPFEGMQIDGYTLNVLANDDAPSAGIGIAASNAGSPRIDDTQISNVRISFADAPNHINDRTGITLSASAGNSRIIGVQMVNVQIEGPDGTTSALDTGIEVDPTAAPNAEIRDISITNLHIRNPGFTNAGPGEGYGVWLRGGTDGVDGFVRNVGIVNSRIIDAEAADIYIDGATVLNTIVVANTLKSPTFPANIVDTGTGTEQGHNILLA